MPIKRRPTDAEVTAEKRRGNRGASVFTEQTFLTDEENAAVREALDSNETTDQFLTRVVTDTTTDEDRKTLAAQYDLTRNLRIAHAQSRDRNQRMQNRREAEPVRQRQPVSPSNPTGAYLDPRHRDLPEYPAQGTAHRKQLQEAIADYSSAAQVLDAALEGMTEEFAEAFAKEDARRAVRDRINNTANDRALAEHRARRNRIG